MTPTIKAELKKIFSIRSTYAIAGFALLLTGFLSFYVEGLRFKQQLNGLNDNLYFAGTITQHANVFSIFGALIALLLLAHEYRFNTIIYTLTASNSRSKVLFSKIIAVVLFIIGYSLLLTSFSFICMLVGIKLSGNHLPIQSINYITYYGKVIFYCECYALAGILFAALIRNMQAAIVALFIIPSTFEALLSLLLKKNAVYLPFTALSQVIQSPTIAGVRARHVDLNVGTLSAIHGAELFLLYIVVTYIITWYIFLHRDAN